MKTETHSPQQEDTSVIVARATDYMTSLNHAKSAMADAVRRRDGAHVDIIKSQATIRALSTMLRSELETIQKLLPVLEREQAKMDQEVADLEIEVKRLEQLIQEQES